MRLAQHELLARVVREIQNTAPSTVGLEGASDEARGMLRELASGRAGGETTLAAALDALRSRAGRPRLVSVPVRAVQSAAAFVPPAAGALALLHAYDNGTRLALAALAVLAGLSVALGGVFRVTLTLKLLHLELRRADSRAPSRARCALRAALGWAPWLALAATSGIESIPTYASLGVLCVVHFALLASDPQRGLFDRLAGTRVVAR